MHDEKYGFRIRPKKAYLAVKQGEEFLVYLENEQVLVPQGLFIQLYDITKPLVLLSSQVTWSDVPIEEEEEIVEEEPKEEVQTADEKRLVLVKELLEKFRR